MVVRSISRSMTGDITVYLENGTFRLTHALHLGPADSGTNGHTVVWTAASPGRAVISGAERVSGWHLSDRARNIWKAPVGASLATRQIYVNGVRAWLASGPAPVKLLKTRSGYRASSRLLARWHDRDSIDFVYTAQLGLMVEPICPVGSISGLVVTMAQPCWSNSNVRPNNLVGFGTLGAPAYIENAYELLNRPGEFYLDRKAHQLYYIPRAGEKMPAADVEAPALQTLLTGNGQPGSPIHNIRFSNLQFSFATWLQPASRDGFSEVQSNYTFTGRHGSSSQGLCQFATRGTCPYGSWTKEPGNVQFSYVRNLSLLNDRFVHLGGAGLNLDNGSQNVTISGSVFTDISGNGIEVGNVNMPRAAAKAQTTGVKIENNHLYGIAVEYHGGVAILIGYAAGSTVSHNQVDHVPYTGISLGWGGWPDKRGRSPVANFSHDNVVSSNLIFDFMQVLSDGGGIYTQGITGPSMAHGEKVTGNVVHDQLAWGRALQSDDGASFVTYSGNVLYNDNYDWGSNHIDYRTHSGQYDPQLVKSNYWQQGDPDSSQKGVTVSRNKLIAGAGQAPASIVSHAGLDPAHRSVLMWRPASQPALNPPERATVLYAFNGKAYVSWRPSYLGGNRGPVSYTIASCRSSSGLAQVPCHRPGSKPVTITTSDFNRRGYAVVTGLSDGSGYTFSVRANGSGGSSIPSIPSSVVVPNGHRPVRPGPPRGFAVRTGQGLVRLLWYAPSSARTQPVLGFEVSTFGGRRIMTTGLRQLVVSNNGGRVVLVLEGLARGNTYRFSLAAVNPVGAGPQVRSVAVRP
jgi:hypothetical protein